MPLHSSLRLPGLQVGAVRERRGSHAVPVATRQREPRRAEGRAQGTAAPHPGIAFQNPPEPLGPGSAVIPRGWSCGPLRLFNTFLPHQLLGWSFYSTFLVFDCYEFGLALDGGSGEKLEKPDSRCYICFVLWHLKSLGSTIVQYIFVPGKFIFFWDIFLLDH